jgi:hypothetical protein
MHPNKKKGKEEEGKKGEKKGNVRRSKRNISLLSGVLPHKISSCGYGAYSDYNELLFFENSAAYKAKYCGTRCYCKQGK